MKKFNLPLILACALACGIAFFAGRQIEVNRNKVEPYVILKAVHDLGQLHTVAYNYEKVFSYESHMEPPAVVSALPLANQVTKKLTSNEALIKVLGTVEAGIDLKQAEIRETDDGLLIILPTPEIYQPQLEAEVITDKRGLLWRDKNLHYKAEGEASKALKETSIQNGIMEKAKEFAVDQIKKLIAPLHKGKTTVQFQDRASIS